PRSTPSCSRSSPMPTRSAGPRSASAGLRRRCFRWSFPRSAEAGCEFRPTGRADDRRISPRTTRQGGGNVVKLGKLAAAVMGAAVVNGRRARWIGGVLMLLPLLWLGAGGLPARAAGLPEVGREIVGPLDLLGKRIPLPPGPWKVAAAGYGRITGPEPGP